MNLNDDALNEGRVALKRLERRLQQRGVSPIKSYFSSNDNENRKKSLHDVRRSLDKVPRNDRLQNRKGSPLGLSLKELDDRGFLDGGVLVPSYYTSLKQRNRRHLEMRHRSSRLSDREKKIDPRNLKAIQHMIFVAVRRGLRIDDIFRLSDPEGRGIIDKTLFTEILFSLGFPFSITKLNDITSRFTTKSSENVDYDTFLRDAGILTNELTDNELEEECLKATTFCGIFEELKHSLRKCIDISRKPFEEVYRMFAKWDIDGTGTITATQLFRVLASLDVPILPDHEQDFLVELLDIDGNGRVDFELLLDYCFENLMHIELNPRSRNLRNADKIQEGNFKLPKFKDDISVSSVISNGEDNQINSINLKNNNRSKRPHTASAYRTNDKHRSIPYSSEKLKIDYQNNQEQSSSSNTNNTMQHPSPLLMKMKRPLTAFARVTSSSNSITHSKPSPTSSSTTGTSNQSIVPIASTRPQSARHKHDDRNNNTNNNKSSSRNHPKNIDVYMNNNNENYDESSNNNMIEEEEEKRDFSMMAMSVADFSRYERDPPIQNENDDEDVDDDSLDTTPNVIISQLQQQQELRLQSSSHYNQESNYQFPVVDLISDNFLDLSADDEEVNTIFSKPIDHMIDYNRMDSNYPMISTPQKDLYNNNNSTTNQSSLVRGARSEEHHQYRHRNNDGGERYSRSPSMTSFQYSTAPSQFESWYLSPQVEDSSSPIMIAPEDERPMVANTLTTTSRTDNTVMMASQSQIVSSSVSPVAHHLESLQSLVLSRHQSGKSLKEIFSHFDRQQSGFFNAADLIIALRDLMITITEKDADMMIAVIAIDGCTNVSLGEFTVFVLDTEHHILQWRVQQVVASLYEQQGSAYLTLINNVFWKDGLGLPTPPSNSTSTATAPSSSSSGHEVESTYSMSISFFIRSLKRIGLELTSVDVERLVKRFDVFGLGMVSVPRFLRMVCEGSPSWQRAEVALSYYQAAQDEAAEALRLIQQGNTTASTGTNNNINTNIAARQAISGLDADMIKMAAYLGIRVFSESHLLWIVADALRAPLPTGWELKTDKKGRTFFYNNLLCLSRWDHPLDPYFRSVRDKTRFRILILSCVSSDENIPLPPGVCPPGNDPRRSPTIVYERHGPGHTQRSGGGGDGQSRSLPNPTDSLLLRNYDNPSPLLLSDGYRNESSYEYHPRRNLLEETKRRPQSARPDIRSHVIQQPTWRDQTSLYPRDNSDTLKPPGRILPAAGASNDLSYTIVSSLRPASAPYSRFAERPLLPGDIPSQQIGADLTYNQSDSYHRQQMRMQRIQQVQNNPTNIEQFLYPPPHPVASATASAPLTYRTRPRTATGTVTSATNVSSAKEDTFASKRLLPYYTSTTAVPKPITTLRRHTIVERAVLGKDNHHFMLPRGSRQQKRESVPKNKKEEEREKQLMQMYKDDLLHHLDAALSGGKRNKNDVVSYSEPETFRVSSSQDREKSNAATTTTPLSTDLNYGPSIASNYSKSKSGTKSIPLL